MSASVSIPIAGFKDVYDVPARREGAARASRLAPTKRCARCTRRCCASAASASPSSPRRSPRWTRCSTSCRTSPRCSRTSASTSRCASTRTIRSSCRRCCSSASRASARPISRASSPQLLGTGFGFVPMSSLTAGWVLSGASSQWKNAKPGKVFDTFLNGDYANPVIVVDEIDKASADGQYDPLGALYELLETRDRDALRRRVRRAADRRLGRGVARHRERRRRAFPSRSSTGCRSTRSTRPTPKARRASRAPSTAKSAAPTTGGSQFPETLSPARRWRGSPRCRRARCAARSTPRSATPRSPAAAKSAPTTSRTAARAQAEDRLLGSS